MRAPTLSNPANARRTLCTLCAPTGRCTACTASTLGALTSAATVRLDRKR